MSSKQWWESGVRFECQGSGKCCMSRGTHGYVYLTLADRKRMARHLGLTTPAFTRRFCERKDGWVYLKPLAAATPSKAEACRFLSDKRCTVYDARPSQCRTWPFWPENMGAKAWDQEVAKFCPGVGKGALVSAEKIREILAEQE